MSLCDYLGNTISRRGLIACSVLALGATSLPALAQLDIEITGVGSSLFPIAIPGFSGSRNASAPVGDIIASDLERSGKFRRVGSADEVPYTQVVSPDPIAFAQAGANAAVIGNITSKGNGRWEVAYTLLDAVNGNVLDSHAFTAPAQNLRMTAHKIADRIYKQLIGIPGCFASRIAYVQKNSSRHELVIADSDGENPRVALRSQEPIISPAWSPDGARVAYVSFESRKPVVYVHELSTGRRRAVANFPGNNSAPAFSPDGRRLAVALSRNGGTHIYLMNVSGGAPTQVTFGHSIDTEPVFSPDGAWIYFTSDRGGSPQIYRQPLAGATSKVSRVSFAASYAVSPALSPDGKKLAFAARTARGFKVFVQDLASGDAVAVGNTTGDESPSFSPNGEFLMSASVANRRRVLVMSSADGRTSSRLSSRGGGVREPAWGPMVP